MEKPRYAVRLTTELGQKFAHTMMSVGVILYNQAKAGEKEDAYKSMISHEKAFGEAERVNILSSIIPALEKEKIPSRLFDACIEMVEDVLESIGDFNYTPQMPKCHPKQEKKGEKGKYERKLKLVRGKSGYEEKGGVCISIDNTAFPLSSWILYALPSLTLISQKTHPARYTNIRRIKCQVGRAKSN